MAGVRDLFDRFPSLLKAFTIARASKEQYFDIAFSPAQQAHSHYLTDLASQIVECLRSYADADWMLEKYLPDIEKASYPTGPAISKLDCFPPAQLQYLRELATNGGESAFLKSILALQQSFVFTSAHSYLQKLIWPKLAAFVGESFPNHYDLEVARRRNKIDAAFTDVPVNIEAAGFEACYRWIVEFPAWENGEKFQAILESEHRMAISYLRVREAEELRISQREGLEAWNRAMAGNLISSPHAPKESSLSQPKRLRGKAKDERNRQILNMKMQDKTAEEVAAIFNLKPKTVANIWADSNNPSL